MKLIVNKGEMKDGGAVGYEKFRGMFSAQAACVSLVYFRGLVTFVSLIRASPLVLPPYFEASHRPPKI